MTWSKEVFAKNLRYYMERNGKTQKELAEIVGVSAPTMTDWLKAKKYPRIDKVERLANYFGILKSDLIEEKDDKPESSTDRTISVSDLIFALFRGRENITEEMLEEVMNFADYVAQREANKNKKPVE